MLMRLRLDWALEETAMASTQQQQRQQQATFSLLCKNTKQETIVAVPVETLANHQFPIA
jgi:hypothetical protein